MFSVFRSLLDGMVRLWLLVVMMVSLRMVVMVLLLVLVFVIIMLLLLCPSLSFLSPRGGGGRLHN